LAREKTLLDESGRLRGQLACEHEKTKDWAEKLSHLYEASRSLLGVLAYTSLKVDLLQTGIEVLAKLLEVRYGAIGILDRAGALEHFIYTGISPEQAEQIGHLPEGRGLLGAVIKDNVSLRLDDMSQDPRNVGFPPHHPAMKSLLAVPISLSGRVYGRIYLCDKVSGETFTQVEEDIALSFAHSLSLVLDNAREVEEVKRARQRLDYLAHFDPLTGLPNRTLLNDRVTQALTHARRMQTRVGLVFLDLDNFKLINDTLSHALGDELLKVVAGRLTTCIREEDTAARLGGDEFVVMLANLGHGQAAAQVAEKILKALETPVTIAAHEIFISTSIGISIYPDHAQQTDDLLAAADAAMYHAKKQGKNNYQFFTAEMNAEAKAYIKLEKHLRRALERDELALHYQPQIELESGRVIGMEALLRWNNSELGMIAPFDFIPLAEETGLIVPIGAWVLQAACVQAAKWRQSGYSLKIAVNLSSRQFLCGGDDLLTTVLQALEYSGLPPQMLELEITESILMQHLETTLAILEQLKAQGISISIDDFGTGYSSLSYLKRFSIDTLKIDKSFINDIATDANDKAIVAAVIAMAQQLNLKVVAEGVENREQSAFLRGLGCHSVQGYYFSKPLSVELAAVFLQDHRQEDE